MSNNASDPWNDLWARIDALATSLARSKAVNVNASATRDLAKEIVQSYFRTVRPSLAALQVDPALLEQVDQSMQRLLTLSNGRNPKRYYQQAIRDLRKRRHGIEAERERLIGASESESHTFAKSGIEQAVVATLHQLIPTAGLSYEQALRDLEQRDRTSYRGSASELRECLREVLDHLAPDSQVVRSAGFKLEKDRTKPTMKQKVQFILRSRGRPSGALSSPKAAVDRIEESAGALARSVYDRGSVSTHVAATREEVLQLKLYVDGVLAELLQIHRMRKAAS